MLRFNLNLILTKRNILHPRQFLIEQAGINHVTASNLLKGDAKLLRLTYVTKLCRALRCTPDELLEWVPAKGESALPENHPLTKLANRAEEEKLVEKMIDKVGSMSPDELRAMATAMQED